MILYKYVGENRETILENKLVCFSQPSQLNDPFEWQPWIPGVLSHENAMEQIQEHRTNPTSPEDEAFFAQQAKMAADEGVSLDSVNNLIAKGMRNFIDTQLMPNYLEERFRKHDKLLGVFCLSQNPDSFLMWSHYADSHKGFIIGFDAENEFFQKPRRDVHYPEIGFLHPVEYSSTRPSAYGNALTFKQEFLTKSQDWSYECEHRIIRFLDECNSMTSDGQYHLFAFPPECVKEVVLGANMETNERTKIQTILNAPDWHHITLRQARLDKQEFKLHYDILK
jgi:hypothetical protein